MQINWKDVAASPGYKSLKAAMIKDIQEASRDIQRGRRPMRGKAEFYKHFRWVIARAINYANFYCLPVQFFLNEWEIKRTYQWWFGYYQECNQPKCHTQTMYVKPQNIRTYYKKDKWMKRDPIHASKSYFKALVREQKIKSKRQGKKQRWTVEAKKRQARYKSL